MNVYQEWAKLLQEVGPGKMMITAYDTAWIARLVEIGEPIGELAVAWLRENQLPDGSWGAEQPLYYHDRVISTLAAISALATKKAAMPTNNLTGLFLVIIWIIQIEEYED